MDRKTYYTGRGSRHKWVEGKQWDLIVTMDDATNEHYSMFFVEEEGTMSSSPIKSFGDRCTISPIR